MEDENETTTTDWEYETTEEEELSGLDPKTFEYFFAIIELFKLCLALLGICANSIVIFFILKTRLHLKNTAITFMLAIFCVDLCLGLLFAIHKSDVSG